MNVPREDQQFPRQAMPKEVPLTSYRNTTSVSCDLLKANKLTENGHDKGADPLGTSDRRPPDDGHEEKGNVHDSQTPTPPDAQLGKWSSMKKEIMSSVLMTNSYLHMTLQGYMWPSTLRDPRTCNFYFQRPQLMVMESCFGTNTLDAADKLRQ